MVYSVAVALPVVSWRTSLNEQIQQERLVESAAAEHGHGAHRQCPAPIAATTASCIGIGHDQAASQNACWYWNRSIHDAMVGEDGVVLARSFVNEQMRRVERLSQV